jgi:hypothetical protein
MIHEVVSSFENWCSKSEMQPVCATSSSRTSRSPTAINRLPPGNVIQPYPSLAASTLKKAHSLHEHHRTNSSHSSGNVEERVGFV